MNIRITFLLSALLAAGFMTGCSTAKPEAMVPPAFTLANKYAASVSLSAPHGKDADAKWTSQIQGSAFVEALYLSLEKAGLFATVLKAPDADYILQVSFVKGDEPAFGFNMTVDLVTRWVLIKKSVTEPVFQGNVSTTYTAKLGDAFAGGDRLRIANEGAAKENIKEGLRRLSQLNL